MIEIEERNDITPLCPHCEEPARHIQYRALSGFLGRRYVYFCGACKKVLGVSHRKGFWMGYRSPVHHHRPGADGAMRDRKGDRRPADTYRVGG